MGELSQNHPFFDGNKRTAFDAMQTFLTVNGLHLKVDVHEACDFVLDLYATHQFQFDNLVPWLRENVAPH